MGVNEITEMKGKASTSLLTNLHANETTEHFAIFVSELDADFARLPHLIHHQHERLDRGRPVLPRRPPGRCHRRGRRHQLLQRRPGVVLVLAGPASAGPTEPAEAPAVPAGQRQPAPLAAGTAEAAGEKNQSSYYCYLRVANISKGEQTK